MRDKIKGMGGDVNRILNGGGEEVFKGFHSCILYAFKVFDQTTFKIYFIDSFVVLPSLSLLMEILCIFVPTQQREVSIFLSQLVFFYSEGREVSFLKVFFRS